MSGLDVEAEAAMTWENLAAFLSALERKARQWEQDARTEVPPEYADRNMHSKYLKLDNHAAGLDDCAADLRELIQGWKLEKAGAGGGGCGEGDAAKTQSELFGLWLSGECYEP